MDKKTRDLIEKADWKCISSELAEYALYKARRIYWRSDRYRNLSRGKTSEDIAYEAIQRTLSGDRSWDPEKDPDIIIFLKSVVDSLMYHLIHSQNHKRLQPLPENGNGNIREDIIHKWSPDSSPTPEEQILLKEEEEQADRIVSIMFEAVAEDAELETILEARMEGCVRPEEIAEVKNMDIKHVYNLIRKLKRRLRKLT